MQFSLQFPFCVAFLTLNTGFRMMLLDLQPGTVKQTLYKNATAVRTLSGYLAHENEPKAATMCDIHPRTLTSGAW